MTNISFDYVTDLDNKKVPVLIEVDPSLLKAIGTVTTPEDDILMLGNAVKNGLRATLKTGSLLTGALYVDFDYYPTENAAELSYKSDFPVVPTLSSGFAQFEVKIASILDKIDGLPLDKTVTEITTTVTEARDAIKEIEKVAAAAKVTLEDDDFRKLPADLRRTLAELEKSLSSVGPDGNVQGDLLRTLDELRGAIRSIEAMSDTIKEKPNSLLFGKKDSGNSKPKAAGKYVDRSNLVIQSGPNKLKLATNHLWAGDLDDSVARVIATNLGRRLNTGNVRTYPWQRDSEIDYQVAMDIREFLAGDDGFAHIEATWRIYSLPGSKLVRSKTFIAKEAIASEDYEAVVAAQSRLLGKLSADIATGIRGR